VSTLELRPGQHVTDTSGDAAVRRRLSWIWTLLFIDVLSYTKGPMIVPIPSLVGQAITQGALWLALLLVLTLNRRRAIRPNMFLLLCTVLGVISFIVSIKSLHFGMSYRAVRLIGFLVTLWLLTPWFGRRDLFLLRCHLRCLVGVSALTVAGMAISPSKAFKAGRLTGDLWPIPTTQLAHYAAVAAGIGVILWMSGLIRRNAALALVTFASITLILTHTRTAVVGLVIGTVVAASSLFLVRHRVRKAFAVGLLVVAIGGTVAFPAVSHWFVRGESKTLFTNLTGRTVVWHELVNAPRTKVQMLFGTGLSNDSFGGLSIDNSWLAAYQTQGLAGDVLIGLFLLTLLIVAAFSPRGPARALALFLVAYCIVVSYTETGLGEASTYLLDLTIAASLLMSPVMNRVSTPILSA